MNRKLGFYIWTMILLILVISDVAGSEQFTISLNAGFNGVYQVAAHTPVRITVGNSGRAVNAEISFRLIENYSARDTPVTKEYRKKVFIPEGTSSVTLPVQLNSYRPGCRITILKEDLILYEEQFDLKGFPSDSPLIVGISRNPSLDPLLPLISEEENFPLVYPHPETFPNVWNGLSGAGLVIFHRLPSVPLTDGQIDALVNWTAAGGKILIIGGSSYSQETRVLLDTLLPVKFTGFTELPGGIRISRIAPPAEGQIYSHDGTVTGIRKNLGKGWVTFLTFDPSRAESSALLRPLWNEIFPGPILAGSGPRIPQPVVTREIFSRTGSTPRFIPTLPVFIILGVYTLMLAALMLFPAPIFRLRIIGAAVLTLSAVFAVFFLFELSGTVESDFTRALTILRGGSGDVLVTEKHVHHGSVGETRFTFQLDKDSVFLPYPRQEGVLSFAPDGAAYYSDTLQNPWNSRYYRSVGITRRQIQFDVQKKNGLYMVSAKEPGDFRLSESILFIHGEPYSIGVLQSGTVYTVDPGNQTRIRIPDRMRPYIELIRRSEQWTELNSTYDYVIAGLVDTGTIILIGGNIVPFS
ncbi:MAG: hypothetical protein ACLFST_04905 [Spirochaetia bacterium]